MDPETDSFASIDESLLLLVAFLLVFYFLNLTQFWPVAEDTLSDSEGSKTITSL